MKVSIYQISMDRDQNRVCFLPYGKLKEFQGKEEPDPSLYDLVYQGTVPCRNLDDVYRMFNLTQPRDYRGRSLSVSDVVRISDAPEVTDGFYYCDTQGFRDVPFVPEHCGDRQAPPAPENRLEQIRAEYPKGTTIRLNYMDGQPQMYAGLCGQVIGVDRKGQIHVEWENGSVLNLDPARDSFTAEEPAGKLQVLLVQPGKYPKLTQMEDSLESMQSMVGGMIEEYMPFEDDVAIICNEEGKISGLPLNRAIYGPDGGLSDIIAGDFFLVYAPMESEKFLSMPAELAKKYEKQFHLPERFLRTRSGIEAVPYRPVSRDLDR